MEGTKENKDDEDQVRQLTSETYFASINVEATLNQLQELGKEIYATNVDESLMS